MINTVDARPSILIATDDPTFATSLTRELSAWDFCVAATNTGEQLWRKMREASPEVVLLDVHEPARHSGVLARLSESWRSTPVIAFSSDKARGLSVRLANLGAVDVIAKPPPATMLHQTINRVVNHAGRKPPRPGLSRSIRGAANYEILGESQAIRDVLELVDDVARSDASVFVLGESGTGKELLARAIHHHSHRSDQVFVPVNVAALPPELAESTLFGNEKGAYTGAETTRQGWCETACGGTLMLDEIGEMDILLQAKMLRFLQDGTFMRVGGNRLLHSDVRVVAATNRDPEALVQEQRMRQDLYYRLNVFPIEMPPLRDRLEDVPILARRFLQRASESLRRQIVGFTEGAMDFMMSYHWPGNIRQLENVVTRMALVCRDDYIGVDHLPTKIKLANEGPASGSTGSGSTGSGNLASGSTDSGSLGSESAAASLDALPTLAASADAPTELSPMQEMEKRAILAALEATGGNAVAAAKQLGVGQATIYRKIKRFAIELRRIKAEKQSN